MVVPSAADHWLDEWQSPLKCHPMFSAHLCRHNFGLDHDGTTSGVEYYGESTPLRVQAALNPQTLKLVCPGFDASGAGAGLKLALMDLRRILVRMCWLESRRVSVSDASDLEHTHWYGPSTEACT